MPRLITACLTVLAVASCGKSTQPIEIPFIAAFGGLPISCDGDPGGPQLTDLRLYVSELNLVTKDARAAPVELATDGLWQRRELALLDFEDGRGSCDNGTAAVNTALLGTVPAGDYHGLRFVVGVPFEDNHGDPLQAKAPLGDAAMHWHWRGGYKFLRAGLRNGAKNFWIHLGSTGCEGTLQNITGCNAPNRVTVELETFDWQRDAVRIELAALVSEVTIEVDGTVSCSSGPGESSCDAPFAALGLGAETQSVFGRQTRP